MAKRRRRRRVDPLRALTDAELKQQANQLLNAALVAPKQQIRRTQADARRQAEADAKMIQGFTQALAGLVGQAGPNVDKVFADATNRQRQLAQGFSGLQAQTDQAAADKANALIQSQGGTARIDPGTGSQVTYALGGMVPGNLLNETGAAMASIAHGYAPGVVGRGQQQIQQRMSKAQEEQAKLREAMDELMAKVPGLRQEILDKLYQREISKAATGIQRDYLGLAGQKEAFDQSYDTAKLAQDAAQAAAGAKKDRGAKTAAARKARTDALVAAKADAWAMAGQLAEGVPVKIGGIETGETKPIPYQQAYAQMWARFAPDLLRLAPRGWTASQRNWWKRQVEVMIDNALRHNGIKKQKARKGQMPAGARGPVG